MSRRTWAVWIAALLAVPLGIALALLAIDILRVPRELAADDVRFQGAPRIQRELWGDLDFLPGDPGLRLLGVSDDVASREAIALFALVDPSRIQIRTPEQEAIRGRVQLEMTLLAQQGGDARLHSRHLNLLGVLTMARSSTSGPEVSQMLSRAVGAFQSAIEVDPTNTDAKRNLEILLRRPEAVTLPPNNPFQGGAQGRFSGQGRAGSGY
jgi:hypothetical protein